MTPVIFWITPLSFSRKTDSEFSLQPRAQLNSRVSFARLLKSSVWFSNPVAKRSYWTHCARYRGGWPSSCTPLKLTQRKSLVFFWLVGSLSRVVCSRSELSYLLTPIVVGSKLLTIAF